MKAQIVLSQGCLWISDTHLWKQRNLLAMSPCVCTSVMEGSKEMQASHLLHRRLRHFVSGIHNNILYMPCIYSPVHAYMYTTQYYCAYYFDVDEIVGWYMHNSICIPNYSL